MNCPECDNEIPSGSVREMIDWMIEQKQKRVKDEFVYGTSFACAKCTARMDPTGAVKTWSK